VRSDVLGGIRSNDGHDDGGNVVLILFGCLAVFLSPVFCHPQNLPQLPRLVLAVS